jgi:enoyl-CoA hydratase/carnithine racemase
MDYIQVSHEGPISFLQLNQSASYNALSLEMLNSLLTELKNISKNNSTRVIVIKGSGKGFCAGHDLKEINQHQEEKFYQELMKSCSNLMLEIQNISQPVIAQIHGVATAAGCQLVASCDLALASSDARFATPGVFIGLFCSTPMVPLSRNIPRKMAMEMLLTGEMISSQRAYEIGLINRVVAPADLDNEVMHMATLISQKSPYVIGLGKRAFYKQLSMSEESQAYDFALQVMVKNLLHDDAKNGINAFLEKKKNK